MVAPKGQPEPLAEPERSSPSDEYVVDGLPELTAAGNRFVSTYIHSGFDLTAAAKAAKLPIAHASLYTTDPAIHAHLDSHYKFLHSTLKCKAAQARDILIDHLLQLLPEVRDPHEKRLLLQQLQRATAASIVPAGRSVAPSSRQCDRADEDQRPSAISDSRPGVSGPPLPHPPSIDPKAAAHALFLKMHGPHSEEDADLAVVADALEYNAEIDGEPVPGAGPETDDDQREETIESLAITLAPIRGFKRVRHLDSISHSENSATEIWNVETQRESQACFTKATLEYTKAPETDTLSRDPGRWLIRKITTSPGLTWEEVKAKEHLEAEEKSKARAGPGP